MNRLEPFLVALYDALSKAETEAFAHGQARMAALMQDETIPADAAVPVYHATDMTVELDAGLDLERTETGQEVVLTQPDDESRMQVTLDVFDLIEAEDVADVDPEDLIDEVPEEEPPDEPEHGTARSVHEIDAIETSTAEILEHSGIGTVADLLTRSPEEVAASVAEEDASVTADRVRTWMEHARAASDWPAQARSAPVETIEGIGRTFGGRLREAGIETLGDLAGQSPETIAEQVSTDEVTVNADRTDQWIDAAAERIAESTEDESET